MLEIDLLTDTPLPEGTEEADIHRSIHAVFDFVDLPEHPAGVSVAVRTVDDEVIQELNSTYRHKDKPTNVLSFPAEVDFLPDEEPLPLGDIAISVPTILREAGEQSKAPKHHFQHMLIHGTLHLLGYDHLTAKDASAMESLEVNILAQLGISDPYEGTEATDNT